MAQITCKRLAYGYNGKDIIKDLNFEINAGDYLCIIGENGAGKTTLMKCLLGLFKPSHGEIVFGDGLKKNEVGYLPQQTTLQKEFPASVKEIVLSGCLSNIKLLPFYRKQDVELANLNIEKLSISNLKNRCFKELSGGQQQKVLLARALCATQKILFLDEPVAGLDPKATTDLYKTIEKLNGEDKITIVCVSHDLASSFKYASHILYVGKNCFYGTKEEFLNSPIYAHMGFLGGEN